MSLFDRLVSQALQARPELTVVKAVVFRQSLAMAFLHLLSQIVLLAIACNSFYSIKFGKGASWKGRNYNFS